MKKPKPKIVYCGFRKWSIKIYNSIYKEYKDKFDFILINSKDDFENFAASGVISDYSLIFFIGWSYIIKKNIVDNYKCICLHPSPLPKYRGGSPIQNQIINNEDQSAVTFFIMNDKIDQGDIVYQSGFSLSGDLDDIFDRITKHGQLGMSILLSMYLKNGELDTIPQDHNKKTYYRRREPNESELFDSDFISAKKAYNKIRALGRDPYPTAFITCDDGTRLYITHAHLDGEK